MRRPGGFPGQARLLRGKQPVGGKERGFGFARAHGRFQHIHARACDGLRQSLLHGVRRKTENILKSKVRHETERKEARLLHGAGHKGRPGLTRIVEKGA